MRVFQKEDEWNRGFRNGMVLRNNYFFSVRLFLDETCREEIIILMASSALIKDARQTAGVKNNFGGHFPSHFGPSAVHVIPMFFVRSARQKVSSELLIQLP